MMTVAPPASSFSTNAPAMEPGAAPVTRATSSTHGSVGSWVAISDTEVRV